MGIGNDMVAITDDESSAAEFARRSAGMLDGADADDAGLHALDSVGQCSGVDGAADKA